MKQTRLIMDMPITVEVTDPQVKPADLKSIFDYFRYIDQTFSTFKPESEISRLNRGEVLPRELSADMRTILSLCEKTKKDSGGYFDIEHRGRKDPSGVVKGWAIFEAAKLLAGMGFKNYYVEAGGDIQTSGLNREGQPWRVGIRNPFNLKEIVKVLVIEDLGVATSGTYERGQHIYNPMNRHRPVSEIVSLTVIGPNICEADRMATAAFAMGKRGIEFIRKLDGFAGYQIDGRGTATMTPGFTEYVVNH